MTKDLDFISRIRARTSEEERLRMEATARAAARRISVLVTRDGSTTDELFFETPPTLADLMARAGSGAFILGVNIDLQAPLAAE
ncbi:MAG: hypothetical protein KDE00_12455 [Rhodobacteraceae bacterium]|nr:hypothetical protein [Paracoccaceae bacterium]